jgi:transcriptional regulator
MGGAGGTQKNARKLINMYIQKHFLQTDQQDIIQFMQKYSFATVVSCDGDKPAATHLPVLVREENDELIILSHFAKANQHWETILDKPVLVIFSQPNAYISPRFYEKEENVPTWNYIAVHAIGHATLITDEPGILKLMDDTILKYEGDYLQQWNGLSEDFKVKMLKGIVAFKITVTELEAKNKLSQNRTNLERQNIINAFSKSDNFNENEIAEYMKGVKLS